MAAIVFQSCAREIVEVVHLTGFYWRLGRLCTDLDIEIDMPDGMTSLNAVANLDNS